MYGGVGRWRLSIATLSPPEWLNSALRWAALNKPTSADHSLPPTKEQSQQCPELHYIVHFDRPTSKYWSGYIL